MTLVQNLGRLISPAFKRKLAIYRQQRRLKEILPLECDGTPLRSIDDLAARALFADHDNDLGWDDVSNRIALFDIPDGTGGVNPGDRRALFYLIRALRPASTLEIGTHIGASTLHIASALFANAAIVGGAKIPLVSVDVADVNDRISRPWEKFATKYSPAEMLQKMGLGSIVEFITKPSLEYFAMCERKFDLIFLDGDHAAATVYREIPAALRVLNQDGVIVLHDYFPNLKPLWVDGSVVPGPFLATERFRCGGAQVVVLPLGDLPWPTKLNSNTTSLALLLKRRRRPG